MSPRKGITGGWRVADTQGGGGFLDVTYLPVNQSYLITWFEQWVAGPLSADDVESWMREHGFVKGTS